MMRSCVPITRLVVAVWLCTVTAASSEAALTLRTEPSVGEVTLSTDSGNPTVLLWGESRAIHWVWATDEEHEANLATDWHVMGSDGVTARRAAQRWGALASCSPAEVLNRNGNYRFWVTASDSQGTAKSKTYCISIKIPPLIETRYHPPREVFLGKLVGIGRTAFMGRNGALPDAVVDSPDLHGGDNPGCFSADGTLYMIFGDPLRYESPTSQFWPCGVLAFTDEIVPEKGLDLSHNRNWLVDPVTRKARSLFEGEGMNHHPNNGGGVVVQREGRTRIWFDYYTRRKPSEYWNNKAVGLTYIDLESGKPAEQHQSLVLWERGEVPESRPAVGPAHAMSVRGTYAYAPIHRGGDVILIRSRIDDLDQCSLSNWHYLVAVGEDGKPTWSEEGLTRNRVCDPDLPTLNFGRQSPGLLMTLLWNPYLNRWLAASYAGVLWESDSYWGPYRKLDGPGDFLVKFDQANGFGSHEWLLGNNGEWVYYGRARYPDNYGTYFQKIHLRPKLDLVLSTKCAVAGDTVRITCRNVSGLPSPEPEAVAVTVDGTPARFLERTSDTYSFAFALSGRENGGRPGPVKVAAHIDIPRDPETKYRITRDVSLIVNHINNVTCRIVSHGDRAKVSGKIILEAVAGYGAAPEDLGEGKPEVRILKTELRHVDAEGETVEDADPHPPYRLKLDTTRFPAGLHRFKIIAYDTLDRRGLAWISLNVANPPQPRSRGNLIADGNMDAESAAFWHPWNGALLGKIAGQDHRSGTRSLLIRSDRPKEEAGLSQTVTGLAGGERLRLTSWTRLRNNHTATLTWRILEASGKKVVSRECSSHGFFRRACIEFENPERNTQLTLQCGIKDAGSESAVAGEPVSRVEAIVDDVVLRSASYPIVEKPQGVTAAVAPSRAAVTLTWRPNVDANVHSYVVYRKTASPGEGAYQKVAEVDAYQTRWTDGAGDPSPAPSNIHYRVVAVDEMGTESEGAQVAVVRR